MKRHRALVGLSHDHHEILLLARLLKSAHDSAARCHSAKRFLPGLRAHFSVEERALAFVLGAGHTKLNEQVQDTIRRHRELETAIARLPCASVAHDDLRTVGTELVEYVRGQERELFQQMQRMLSADVLGRIAECVDLERDIAACRFTAP